VKTRLFVDAIVCAAAEALDASPRAVRGALLAAFACAREAGLPVETVEKALAPPATKRRAAP
jgi:MoxR-like ATPase